MNYVSLKTRNTSISSSSSNNNSNQQNNFRQLNANAQSTKSRFQSTSRNSTHSIAMKTSNNNILTNNVQQKLATLALRLEKELQQNTTVDDYFGQCAKCELSVTDASDACQAMGEIYHNKCFKCVVCDRTLCNKNFYRVHEQIYCEEDYLFTGFQQDIEKCFICDHLIMDNMIQALGHSYHSACFRCSACNECLDGFPFTIDKDRRLFCLYDYHNTYAPRCAKCAYPICPEEGSDETIRVVAMKKNFHLECYRCEDCQSNLSDEQTIARLGACCPLEDGTLLCYRCRIRRDDQS